MADQRIFAWIATIGYRSAGGRRIPVVSGVLSASRIMTEKRGDDKPARKLAKVIDFLPALRRKSEKERKRLYRILKEMND